jgi:hypothetical protein
MPLGFLGDTSPGRRSGPYLSPRGRQPNQILAHAANIWALASQNACACQTNRSIETHCCSDSIKCKWMDEALDLSESWLSAALSWLPIDRQIDLKLSGLRKGFMLEAGILVLYKGESGTYQWHNEVPYSLAANTLKLHCSGSSLLPCRGSSSGLFYGSFIKSPLC